jgi:cytoskeleton protein RodZ
MTSQPSNPSGQDSREKGLFDHVPAISDAAAIEQPTASFGSRLRAAREARGLELEACAHALKLPHRVLRLLERDEYDGIDYQVYLGSYLSKYGRHLGVDETAIQAELARIRSSEPVLVATGGISHSRYLLERYATAATYVVLTAVIVVPVIWLGVRGTLDRDISHLAPLDAAPVAQQDAPAKAASSGALPSSAVVLQPPRIAPPKPADEQPLLASMVPNISADVAVSNKPLATAAAVGAGDHSLDLSLANASWVEVIAADGSKLEYGLLPGGSSKTYRSDQPLEVRLGNSSGATVRVDGAPVALDAFRHANVAHFHVEMKDGKAVPASM